MQTFQEMLRDFDGLEITGNEMEFPNDNDCGYVHDWYCRVVYETADRGAFDSALQEKWATSPIIEFYSLDTNQFVSAYYIDTFIDGWDMGLDLQGDVPAWSLTVADANVIREWCEDVVSNYL